MPFEHLVACVSKLLSENGVFSVIIPFKEEAGFVDLALKHKLFQNRTLHVKGNTNSDIKRSLIEFSFTKKPSVTETLIIETGRHQYTQEYINLTNDFYLNM